MVKKITLTAHIDTDGWSKFYGDTEHGHVLGFCYSLLKWSERDNADSLEFTSNEIVWKRAQAIVGRFPITVRQPTPTFVETLCLVIERDIVVSQYCEFIGEDTKRAYFRLVARRQ